MSPAVQSLTFRTASLIHFMMSPAGFEPASWGVFGFDEDLAVFDRRRRSPTFYPSYTTGPRFARAPLLVSCEPNIRALSFVGVMPCLYLFLSDSLRKIHEQLIFPVAFLSTMRSSISPLEKALLRASQTSHPSPVDKEILQTSLPSIDGHWFDVGRAAVETLAATDEIIQFLQEYTTHISKDYGLSQENAARSAREIVGYCTGYVDDEQANRWFRALPDIRHPVTGRKRPFVLGAVDAFYARIAVKNRQQGRRVVERLEDRLSQQFTTKEEGAEEGAIFVRIIPRGPLFQDAATAYLFLTGIAYGVASSFETDGFHPSITIEYLERTMSVQ